MMKSILFLISLLFMLPCMSARAIASGSFCTHPHTNALELKPTSLDNSFKTASICFLGVGDCDPNVGFGKGDDYSVDTAVQCKNEGFIQLNCNSVQQGDGVCPYNPAYGKGCKCRPGLVSCAAGQVGVGTACNGQYASCQCKPSLVACAANQNGKGAYCGGKYESCSCKPEYQYNSSNCTSPRSFGGATCGGKYTNCTCPGGVSTGAYGCKTYYGSPCSSVCQVAYSDNCRNRSSVATPYGCISYFADCGSACERAYGDNCRNRSDTYAPSGCQQAWGDCSSKCEIPYGDNCRNRTAVATPYGCQSNWADCGSKCQVAYGDNCRKRTTVSAPHGCGKYYSDCSSKCEVAYGPSCKIADIYYSDGTCIASSYHTSEKTALGVVVYITDGGNHGQVMAAKELDIKYSWGNGKGTDMETEIDAHKNNYDSCGNTNKIIADGDSTMYPAAWAARNYVPSYAPETKGKWCLPTVAIFRTLTTNCAGACDLMTPSTLALKKLGHREFVNTKYWTSTFTSMNIWAYEFCRGCGYNFGAHTERTYTPLYVSPVMEF